LKDWFWANETTGALGVPWDCTPGTPDHGDPGGPWAEGLGWGWESDGAGTGTGWRGEGPEKFEELIKVLEKFEKFELEKLGFEKFEEVEI
jgi:hypothetical protein